MISIVVNGSPWDDDVATRAAMDAAERLREEYSLMVFVELNNESLVNGHLPWDSPTIVVGSRSLPVVPEVVSYSELVDWIVQTALEEAASSSRAPTIDADGARLEEPAVVN